MKKRVLAAIVFLMMLFAFSAGLCEEALLWAAGLNEVYEAWQAVREKYGFTKYQMGLFYTQERSPGDATVVFGSTVMAYSEQFGSYTVTLRKNGKHEAKWSHDGKESLSDLEKKGLDSPIWGHVQGDQIVALDQKYMGAMREMEWASTSRGDFSVEEYAKLSQMLTDAGYHTPTLYVLPSEEDLTEEEAVLRARNAVCDTYGIADEDWKPLDQILMLTQFTDFASKRYWITFIMEKDPDTPLWQYRSAYDVTVDARSGEILQMTRSGEFVNVFLPEGPLSGKGIAVQEFFMYGGFDKLTHEERAEVQARLYQAGFESHLQGIDYQRPGEDALPEEEAVETAKYALRETCAFTDELFELFELQTSYIMENSGLIWLIQLKPKQEYTDCLYEFREAAGVYTVKIDDATGMVTHADWSKRGTPLPKAYDETDWVDAPAWNAEILGYFSKVAQELKPFAQDGSVDWEMEKLAEMHRILRSIGKPREDYSADLPDENDITLEQAVRIAKLAFAERYDFSGDEAEISRQSNIFHDDGENRYWFIQMLCTENGAEDYYWIKINARTREIMQIHFFIKGNG